MISDERRWTIAGLLFASGFINYLDRAILSVALPLVAVDLHLGPTAKGTLLSAFFWSYALMQLPMGLWSDRFTSAGSMQALLRFGRWLAASPVSRALSPC